MGSQLLAFSTLANIPASVKVFGGVCVCVGATAIVYSKLNYYQKTWKLDRIRKERQDELASEFERLQNAFPFTEKLREITELSMEELMDKLQSRELLAKQVLTAFLAKTLEITQEFNCVTEFVPHAFKLAAELDSLAEVKGPFHGLPICVKDDTDLEGMDTTVGLSNNLNKPASESAVLVKILVDLGAVPFCKTNCPQTCNSYGSHNPIYGRTLNPLNKSLSPGGSSSGTGCLVAAGGVPFGTGGDTGGSLRIPAHWNGISTLKPTLNRLSRKGLKQCIQNCIGFTSVGFVLAKYPSEVALIFKEMTENNLQNRYDANAVPIPWNESLFTSTKPLRIGYYTSMKHFPCIGDTVETVLNAKRVFESLGHTVIPFQMPDIERGNLLEMDLGCADLGKNVLEDLKHDRVSPSIRAVFDWAAMPFWKRKLLTSIPILRNYYGHLTFGMNTRLSSDLWDAVADRDALIADLLDDMQKLDLDLILGPAFPFPAPGVLDAEAFDTGANFYTVFWNLVDFPAGVVPFGTETGKHDEASRKIASIYGIHEMTIKNAVGMPIGVQLAAKPYHEEAVLRGMVALDKYCRNSKRQDSHSKYN